MYILTIFLIAFIQIFTCKDSTSCIEIKYGNVVEPIGLHIKTDDSEISQECKKMIINMLEKSGIFKFDATEGQKISSLIVIIKAEKMQSNIKIQIILKNKMGKTFVDYTIQCNYSKLHKGCAILCDKIYSATTSEADSSVFNSKNIYVEEGVLVKKHMSGKGFKRIASGSTKMYSFPTCNRDFIACVELNTLSGSSFLYLINKRTKQTRRFLFNGNLISVEFSPIDLNILAINMIQKDKVIIGIFNMEDMSFSQIGENVYSSMSPVFTKDGSSIIFSCNKYGPKYSICKVDLNNKKMSVILSSDRESYFSAEYSHNQKFLACTTNKSVKIFKANSSEIIWDSCNEFKSVDRISWAPKSDSIIVICAKKSNKHQLFIFNILTKSLREIPCTKEVLFNKCVACKSK
ncbi:hypothetical protein [Candidatus Gromoviella agglomerans]|uniref:hypothetical protein n=1 Tax=Candidatus Gromoviella agglomerans TaxID=2806609 RepID=UPI001E4BC0CC|nr:hypothetical protein [Candidatus Gromoviella agglomerans]UFX98352.1 Protein TolB [Candidatus Gromoviella agglomerans]